MGSLSRSLKTSLQMIYGRSEISRSVDKQDAEILIVPCLESTENPSKIHQRPRQIKRGRPDEQNGLPFWFSFLIFAHLFLQAANDRLPSCSFSQDFLLRS